MSGKELDVEIFAIGKWNGMTFTEKHLNAIVDNFKSLADVLKVPIKFGHNDEQKMTDGQPAIGWIDSIWMDATTKKLMAKLIDLPDIVYNAIIKKLYRKVSIELDREVTYKGKDIGDVLTAVALLGADLPAVSTIDDLTAYMSAKNDGVFTSGSHHAFSAISTTEEDDIMSAEQLKDLSDQMTKLSKKIDSQGEQINDLTAENTKLKADKTEFERKDKERKDDESKSAIKLARETVVKTLEDAVKDEKILPAQRENFNKLLNVDDDAAVVAIDVEQLKSMIDS